ncbi:sickle tail protein isoform X3 [Osmerus eperlanus]|uniref:sickle tail protein isoform X3 n=1 Tax=Osmerus eperlanus TaxID=29151 RepID=UPI002E0FBF24
MSKSSRLGRPSSGGSKQGPLRKELQGNRSCMLRVGERLMRAGSEGNLVRAQSTQQNQLQQPQEGRGMSLHTASNSAKEPGGGHTLPRLSSSCSEDPECIQRKQILASDNLSDLPPRSPSTRRYTIGGARGARDGPRTLPDSQAMQQADVERRKEVFLDHLRQKYPHHAAVIMGHHERMREQVRTTRTSASPPPGAGVVGVGEQLDPLSVVSLESLETMSEEYPLPAVAAFTRGCRARASLPVARSSSQPRDRPLGVLYLQYGEETKQIRMPSDISSGDIVRTLFVSAFPQQLTMKMLESPSVAIYIKDDTRNVYYELSDVRNITAQSCLKVYHKDPAHAFNRNSARPGNSQDGRIPREILYGSHSPVHTLQSSNRSALHTLQGSMSPPTARSMPSSPSRIPYGSRGAGSAGGAGSTTLPRDRMSSVGTGRSVTPCPSSSAILERRDVKPDEDLGCSKSMALVVRGEGGVYPDPYSTLQEGGRLSIASSQGSAPAPLADVVDRASIKPYGDILEQQHSHYRQKSRRYGESQLPPMGTKTPPPSPHRVSEVRMIDSHSAVATVVAAQGHVAAERMSPIRRSLRRDSNGTGEVISRTRSSVSSSSSSSVFVDLPAGHPDRVFQSPITPNDPQTSERMKAMEQQIASLAGLVQHALAIAPTISEVDGKTAAIPFNNSLGVSLVPAARSPAPLTDSSGSSPQAPPPDAVLQTALSSAQRNVSDLRLQLQQLRQLQVQNQQSVRGMLRMMEEEMASMMADRLRTMEERLSSSREPGHRQRAAVDQERLQYLGMEERVLMQLGDLEEYVDQLRTDSSPSSTSHPGQLSVTLKDVEEGAVNLRRVGEALAGLKAEYPSLQGKMRTVLRVEVEAVRFLKEEPLKMDSMLKRVKALTETLSGLRRYVTESHSHGPEAGSGAAKPATMEGLEEMEESLDPILRPNPAQQSPKPQPRSSVRPPLAGPPTRPDPTPASATPASPGAGPRVSPRSREGSPALQKRVGPWRVEGNTPSSGVAETAARPAPLGESQASVGPITPPATDAETTEEAMREVKQSETSSSNPSDFDQMLQEAQASLMRAIPDLEVPEPGEDASSGPPTPPDQPATVQAPPDKATASQPPPASDMDSQSLPPAGLPSGLTLPDEVDAPQPKPAARDAAQSSPVPAEPPVQPGAERPPRPMVEKPRRPSVERERRQSPDMAGKSPPPPPPRRFYPASPGLTTGRSGEVIYTTRKESVTTQEEEEEVVVVPQPKPIRQPPEVKPKPQTTLLPPPAPAPETELQEEEEEEDQFMKELQVFQKCSVREVGARCVVDLSGSGSKAREIETQPSVLPPHTQVMYYVTAQMSNENVSSGVIDQSEGKGGTLPSSQVANCTAPDLTQRPELLTPDQLPSLYDIQDGVPNSEQVVAGLEEREKSSGTEQDMGGPVQVEQVVKQMPSSMSGPAVRQVVSPPVLQDSVPGRQCSIRTSPTWPQVQSNKAGQEDPVCTSGPPPSPSPQSVIDTQGSQQEVLMRSSRARARYTEEGSSLNPDLPEQEAPPPPPPSLDNMAFMITNSKVQALSRGEYQQLVRTSGSQVQTVTVSNGNATSTDQQEEHHDNQYDRKPVIFVFDEPMDIHSAYKRLSTIFESEEELGILPSQGCIQEEDEEEEEEETGRSLHQVTTSRDVVEVKNEAVLPNSVNTSTGNPSIVVVQRKASGTSDDQAKTENTNDNKQETKKKFKFKFPKNKLAAISQALRTGTKTGKKTLQVVVYEEETGQVEEKTTKEIKRLEITPKPHQDPKHGATVTNTSNSVSSLGSPLRSDSQSRTEVICKSAYDSINSLEETIKQLEITVDTIGVSSPKTHNPGSRQKPRSPSTATTATVSPAIPAKQEREGSTSKRPASQGSKAPKAPQTKKARSQLPKPTLAVSTKKQTGSAPPSSSRLGPSKPSGSPDKPAKGQSLQDNQRQFRQPRLLAVPR